MMLSFCAHIKGFDFHLGKSQRVADALPVMPLHTVIGRRCVAAGAVVVAVQVGVLTAAVPPATFVSNCTRAA